MGTLALTVLNSPPYPPCGSAPDRSYAHRCCGANPKVANLGRSRAEFRFERRRPALWATLRLESTMKQTLLEPSRTFPTIPDVSSIPEVVDVPDVADYLLTSPTFPTRSTFPPCVADRGGRRCASDPAMPPPSKLRGRS